MQFFPLLLFALAVSMDGFMVGVAYGIKRIKLPFSSLLIISVISGFVILASMILGRGLSKFLSIEWAAYTGAIILLGLGCFYLLQAWRIFLARHLAAHKTPILSVNIRPLGIMIQILAEPEQADQDLSGEIGAKEAWLLGLALSLDSLAAGIGLALTGNHVVVTAALVGILQFTLVRLGLMSGNFFSGARIKQVAPLLSGGIFILLGLFRMW